MIAPVCVSVCPLMLYAVVAGDGNNDGLHFLIAFAGLGEHGSLLTVLKHGLKHEHRKSSLANVNPTASTMDAKAAVASNGIITSSATSPSFVVKKPVCNAHPCSLCLTIVARVALSFWLARYSYACAYFFGFGFGFGGVWLMLW